MNSNKKTVLKYDPWKTPDKSAICNCCRKRHSLVCSFCKNEVDCDKTIGFLDYFSDWNYIRLALVKIRTFCDQQDYFCCPAFLPVLFLWHKTPAGILPEKLGGDLQHTSQNPKALFTFVRYLHNTSNISISTSTRKNEQVSFPCAYAWAYFTSVTLISQV